MNKENTLLVLWIIFGFVFITAIDSILVFVIHLIYFGLVTLEVSFESLSIILPITTLILYLLTTAVLIKRLNIKSKISGIYLTEFPKKAIVILGIIAFALSPITNKLSGLFAEYMAENTEATTKGYLSFYGWFYMGFSISQLVVLGILVIVMLIELKKFNKN